MNKTFNTYGSIEIERDICKYRLELDKVREIKQAEQLEEELKNSIFNWGDDRGMLIAPISVEFINHFVIVFYNLKNHYSLSYLKELPLINKLPYFYSLLDLFRKYEEIPFLTERLNFVVDPYEERIKIILFETENLKIYSKDTTPTETLKAIICSSFTMQDSFITLPKRADFLDPSEVNIKFIENLYKMESIDDIYFLLEKTLIELEMSNDNEPAEVVPTIGKKSKKNKGNTQSKVAPQKNNVPIKNNTKNKRKLDGKTMALIAVGLVVIVGYLFMSMSLNNTSQIPTNANLPISETFLDNSTENLLLKSYQSVYNNDLEGAYQLLKTIPATTIDDINLLIDVYVRSNKTGELIDKHPNIANEVISYLVANDKINFLEELTKGMTTVNPYVVFELAALTNTSDTIIQLKDKIEMNARREQQIVSAYLALGQSKEALDFANNTKNPDLIKQATNSLR